MSSHVSGNPRLTRDGGDWVLVLERMLEHPIEEVWAALTQAEQIPRWAPFTTDRDLTTPGPVRLAHIDMPEADERQGDVLEVNAPGLLVLRWGADILRWELSGEGDKTLLVLRHRFADRQQAPSYAAGWHLCLDGLAGTVAGKKMPSMVGHNAVKYGWRELYERYAGLLGMSSS
ncbi:SRPBCC family protein [Alicyclobacillus macrosporangiidus]|uniref:SRPBCC family protein n=1 Tax=Alicyclobacillus macrosporangiidus TaxID=392015 RepID=UPI000553BAEA|nr:SRPBCC family protein [Alicyclobacillus macrosporangiidus]